MTASNHQRLVRGGRRQHRVAVEHERVAGELADVRLVLDDQDRLTPTGRAPVRPGRVRADVGGHARQVNPEGRAAPHVTVHHDLAAALLDDAVHRGQTEPGAAVHGLRREERLEDPLERRGVHSLTRVLHAEHHVRSGHGLALRAEIVARERDVGGDQLDAAPVRHGVTRVDEQIHEHLIDLGGIGQHRARVDVGQERHRDVLAEQPLEHRQHGADLLVHVQALRGQELLAAEGQELPRDVGRAVRGALDDLDLAPARVVGAQLAHEHDAPARNHGDEVVEVVSDTAGQTADRLHLLGLQELLLGHRELVVGRAKLLVEPRVVHRDGRVVGERLGEIDLLVRIDPAVADHERPDRGAPHHQRDREGGPILRPLDVGAESILERDAWIRQDVGALHGSPGLERHGHRPGRAGNVPAPPFGRADLADQDEVARIRIGAIEDDHWSAEQPRHRVDDGLRHALGLQ